MSTEEVEYNEADDDPEDPDDDYDYEDDEVEGVDPDDIPVDPDENENPRIHDEYNLPEYPQPEEETT
jgi:hypothetical protein